MILGLVQAASGRQFWSSQRLGRPASRRAGVIAAAAGAVAWVLGVFLQRTLG